MLGVWNVVGFVSFEDCIWITDDPTASNDPESDDEDEEDDDDVSFHDY